MTPQAPSAARPLARVGLGHRMRLGMSRREIWLALGHLLVIATALEDEEVALAVVEFLGLGAGWLATVETTLIFAVLAAWGLLTLGWVRCARGSGSAR
jgi:hypothetical protein